jgi:hypothetical protein
VRSCGEIVALGAVALACTAPGGRSAARGVTSATLDSAAALSRPAKAPASRFHVAALDRTPDRDFSGGAIATPCAIRGRTFICSGQVPLASEVDGLDVDATVAQATRSLEGKPVHLAGRWPDDAWLVTETNRHDGAGRHSYAYRWTADHWERFADWTGYARHTAASDDGLLVEGVSHDGDARDHGPLAYIVGSTERPLPGVRLIARQALVNNELEDVVGEDGAVFVLGSDSKTTHLMLEEKLPGSATTRTFEIAARESTARLWARSARDLVVFGASVDVDEGPLFRHFDGETWSPLEPPPGVDIIVAYGRSEDGTERVFAFRGEVLSLWERVKGARWESLLLPAVGKGETLGGHWITDDDAWVHIEGVGLKGRLLRLRPVTHVIQLTDGAPEVMPVSADDPVAAAAPPPLSPALAPERSPFHDAVVSYPDKPDAERPNALRLCPVRGRTFVCGLTSAPLVSTDDGVVVDVATETASKAFAPEDTLVRAEQVSGSWPDHAWITARGAGTRDQVGFHYENGAWRKAVAWESTTFGPVAPFGAGLLVPDVAWSGGQEKSYPLRLLLPHGKQAPASSTIVSGGLRSYADQGAVNAIARGGDALFLMAIRGHGLAVERWSGPGGQVRRADAIVSWNGEAPWVQASLWAASADDAVVFGSLGEHPKTPVLQAWDGKAWGSRDLPPGVDRVAAYDRTTGGKERIFTYAGETVSLYERAAGGGAWEPIVLPALPPGDHIQEVWLANDDAWLLIWTTSPRAPRLMRMQPVKHVWTYPRALAQNLGW